MLKRFIHFLWFMLVVFGLVVLIAAAVTQVILWTDLPGQWVLSRLNQKTGMQFTADRFRMTWDGTTTLSNLTIRFPLEDKPFVQAQHVTLEHTWLVGLIWQNFRLDRITIDNALARLLQDQHGRWNLQLLTEIERTPRPLKKSLNLPAINATNIEIYIRDRLRQELTIKQGQMQAKLKGHQWSFEAAAWPSLSVKGSVVTHSPYTQQLYLHVNDLQNLSSELMPDLLRDLQADAHWNGFMSGEQIQGRLTFDRMQGGDITLTGELDVKAGSQDIQVRTGWMKLEHTGYNIPLLLIEAGQVDYQSQSRTMGFRDFIVSSNNVRLNADALWDMQSDTVRTDGRWLWVGPDVRNKTEGRWSSTAQIRRPGLKSVEFEIEGSYQSPDRQFQTHAVVSGSGTDWKQSLWTVRFPVLKWTNRRNTLNWGPGQVVVRADWPTISLREAAFENMKKIRADGFYNADQKTWQLTLDAEGIRMQPDPGADMNVTIRAKGDADRAVLSEAAVHWGDFRAGAEAAVRLADGKIEQGTLLMSGRMPEYKDTKLLTEFSNKPWQLQAAADGTIRPTAMNLTGQLQVGMPKTEPASVDVLKIPYQVKISGPRITLETASLTSDEGSWVFQGYYQMDQQAGRLLADVNNLPLSILLEPFARQDFEGTVSAKLTADLARPDLSQLDVNGIWLVENFSAASFAAQKAFGRIHMENGKAELTDVFVQQDAGQLSGSGTINLDTRQASFQLTAGKWLYPAGPSPFSVTADAQMTFDMDLQADRVAANGRLDADVHILDQHAGSLQITATLENRLLYLNSVKASLLDGTLTGQARIPLRDWVNAQADLTFADIQLNRLGQWQRQMEHIGGAFSGQLRVGQADQPRPLEPLKIILQTQLRNGRFNDAPLGGLQLTAFAGPNRVLVTDSLLELFSGTIQAQARWTMHDRAYVHAKAAMNNIDLNQVVQAFDPNANPVKGIVNGAATLLTTANLPTLSGRIHLSLAESDLINNTVVGSVYKALAFGLISSKPSGYGNAELYVEGTKLVINSFYYFNEGVEIRGSGEIQDFTKGADSPITGLVFGTTRPLKGLDLPGISELDELMQALQVGSAVVEVAGTLGNAETKVVPLPNVTEPIRNLIWKQLHED